MSHCVEFEILKYVHMLIQHTIDTYSGFQWASAISSEGDDSEIAHLLEMMAILEMPLQTGADDSLTCVSTIMHFAH